MTQILRLDSSARKTGSITRALGDDVIAQFTDATVTTRDLSLGVPIIDEAWVTANFTPADQRDEAQKAALALSDEMVAELKAADVVVIGVPMYNFGAPAAFKAWVDQIARAGLTFKYTESGPVGLLEGKRAIVLTASGGVEIGSDADFLSDYVRHVLGFVGITEVEVIAANQMMVSPEESLASAKKQVSSLANVA
ncbi:MAG: NAD(P)H-dependent oxidoreductase [Pseudomonadota bacterium]